MFATQFFLQSPDEQNQADTTVIKCLTLQQTVGTMQGLSTDESTRLLSIWMFELITKGKQLATVKSRSRADISRINPFVRANGGTVGCLYAFI